MYPVEMSHIGGVAPLDANKECFPGDDMASMVPISTNSAVV